MKPTIMRLAFAMLLITGYSAAADAHCFVGNRFFPATIEIDDPCVADELSLPTVAGFKNGDEPSADEIDISGEYSKTITPNFSISFEETWIRLDTQGKGTASGFDNLSTNFKYQFVRDADREPAMSIQLDADWRDTGAKAVDRESFTTSFPALAFVALLFVPGSASAAAAMDNSISVEKAWSRATPQGAEVAAAYLTIVNHGDTPERFVSASTEVAGKSEIHQMKMTDGKMEMRPVPEGIAIPAESTVVLEPMGHHLMLIDLKHPLQKGETFAGTLTFEHAGTIDVTFSVEGIGAPAPSQD